jgi:gas vesicle protein
MQAIFSFIKGCFCGLIVGGGLGLLLAPRPGIETQRLIKQRIDEIIAEAQRAAEEEKRRLEEELAAATQVRRAVEEEIS